MNLSIKRTFKILVFILLILITDQIGGLFLRKLYFTQKAGSNHALIYSFKECKADILIFGASQALHNYDPRILSDSLKMSCYNAGQDGGHSILLQYAQIKVITERYNPKIIILDFQPNLIVRYPGDYDRLAILLPFYKDYPEIRPLILLHSPYEKIKLVSAIYPFNSNILNIIRFNTNTSAAKKKDIEGYVPLKEVMAFDNSKPGTIIDAPVVIDSNKVNALTGIIQICKKKNIALYIVSSPIYHAANEKTHPITPAAQVSLSIIYQNNVNYIDLSFDSAYAGKMSWFKDKAHLNEVGANRFSSTIASFIKRN
jgi:hypothetical protein